MTFFVYLDSIRNIITNTEKRFKVIESKMLTNGIYCEYLNFIVVVINITLLIKLNVFLANLQSNTINNLVDLTDIVKNQVKDLINDNKSLNKSINDTKFEFEAFKLKQDMFERK